MSEKEVQKEEIKKNEEEEKKGEQGPRRGGGYQNKRGDGKVQYVEKGSQPRHEGGEHREKQHRRQQTKRPKQVRKPQAPYKKYEKREINLDTVIPEKPKKNEIIRPMDESEYQKKYDELSSQIDTLWNNFHKIDSSVKNTSQGQQPDGTYIKNLYDVSQKKAGAKKDAHEKWKALNDKFKLIKADHEKLYDQSQKYRQKMKVLMTKDEIEDNIKALENQLYNEVNNMQQEKKLIKEIEDFEKSLPFAAPLDALNKQFEAKKLERKLVQKEMNSAWSAYEETRRDWQLVEDELQQYKQTRQDSGKVKVSEEMQLKRQETEEEQEKIITKIKELNLEYRKQWEDFYEQEQLIKDIDWMAKIQKRLKREEEQRKYDEEERKAEEEAKKEIQENPFREDLELVTLLVSYCEKLAPKEKKEEAKPTEQQKDIQEIIQKGEWKKENLQVMKCKKEIENDFFSSKKKQKKVPQQKVQSTEQKPEHNPLNHKLDVIGYFDKLKVLPPLWAGQVENTIKQLIEKKEYFMKFQDGSMPEEEKKELTEQKEEKEEKDQEDKKEDKKEKKEQKKKQAKLEFNEEDFPSM